MLLQVAGVLQTVDMLPQGSQPQPIEPQPNKNIENIS